MALNIKNEDTVRLARQVAATTGESLTDAVRIALEERLARLGRRPEDAARIWSELEALRHSLGPYRAGMTTDDLYDEDTGLPA